VVGVEDRRGKPHILRELGFATARDGDEIRGRASVVPEMWTPGTSSLRTSVLATWADVAAGQLVLVRLAPKVPVTLSLDVHAYRPPPETGTIHAVGRILKFGKAVVVVGVDFHDEDGDPVAVSTASFMVAPDPGLSFTLDLAELESELDQDHGPLRVPLAERARVARREPGVAVLPHADDALNASNTIQGGLVALAAEEAVLSATGSGIDDADGRATPGGTALSTMSLRYLSPLRTGPAVATAEVRAGLGRVEVRDAGAADRLAVIATTRAF
jgi:acyl-coenzyme A thioesterase PaaI-like protein